MIDFIFQAASSSETNNILINIIFAKIKERKIIFWIKILFFFLTEWSFSKCLIIISFIIWLHNLIRWSINFQFDKHNFSCWIERKIFIELSVLFINNWIILIKILYIYLQRVSTKRHNPSREVIMWRSGVKTGLKFCR